MSSSVHLHAHRAGFRVIDTWPRACDAIDVGMCITGKDPIQRDCRLKDSATGVLYPPLTLYTIEK